MEVMAHQQQTRTEGNVLTGSSSLEALGGAAAVVLAIIGLAHIAPLYMLSIAGIVLGAALLFDGGVVASEYAQLMTQSGNGQLQATDLGGGLSGEAMAGITAIILGILALLGMATPVLMAIAAIVLGVGIILGSGLNARLNAIKIDLTEETGLARQAAHGMVSGATGAEILVGIGAMVLGIVALASANTLVLALVAMLAMGVALLLSGTALATRMFSLFR